MILGLDEQDDASEGEQAIAAAVADDAQDQAEEAQDEQAADAPSNPSSEEDVERARVMRNPRQPTEAERDEHEATHMPYREWCPACVRGRGISDQHQRHRPHITDAAVPEEAAIPTISIDYTFVGTRTIKAGRNPHLAIFDNEGGGLKVFRTRKKGVIFWVIKALMGFIATAGFQACRIAIKCDNETSIVAIRNALMRAREAPTVPLNVPVRESKPNGAMERAIRSWQGQRRTIKCFLERKLQRPLPILHPIVEWVGNWASTLLYRFKNKRYGRTPYYLVTGHQSSRPIAPFGGMVEFKLAERKPHVHKGESVWRTGAFLGMADRSNQPFILSTDGIKACRTVRRVSPDRRWNIDFLMASEWTIPEALYGEPDPPEEHQSLRVEPPAVPQLLQPPRSGRINPASCRKHSGRGR